jgi:subtilisin family serine protease
MSKIDPKLEHMLQEHRDRLARSADEPEVPATEAPPVIMIPVLLRFSGDLDELVAVGLQPQTVLQNLATGRIAIDDLPALAEHPNLEKLELSRPMYSELDTSRPSIGVDAVHSGTPPRKGSGVIVGVIDSGFDYRHDCFRNADGSSRILFLWDMRPPSGATGTPPSGFTEGIEYTKSQLDAALAASDPLATVPHEDTRGHGSHVAGIAAGNGRAEGNCRGSGTYVGMAPEADLIVVRLRAGTQELGESNNLVDAMNYIFIKAEEAGKPAVINISQGDNIGAHDGTSLVEMFLDLFVFLEDGRAVVKSAGNEGNKGRHAQGTITATGTPGVDVQFQVPANVSDTVIIDLWYEGPDRFSVSLDPPTGSGVDPIAAGGRVTNSALGNGNTASINSQLDDVDNHDNRIQIEIDTGTQARIESGLWTMNLTADTLSDGSFHAWIERNTRTRFQPPFVSAASTISIPGTAREAITVGGYSDRGDTANQLTASSSRGPCRDGVRKPEIVAPGYEIISVKSGSLDSQPACIDLCADRYQGKDGTSMAAPHVAGVIALMLEKNATLSIAEIRQHLFENTRKDPGTMGTLPNDEWGEGIVDAPGALGAVAVAPVPEGPVPTAAPAFEDPIGGAVPVAALDGASLAQPTLPEELAGLGALLDTARGQEYAELARRHWQEVRNLIDTNRRVAAVWLRRSGPDIVRSLLYASYNPEQSLPKQVNGQPLAENLKQILAVLRRYGSKALQADIDRHGAELLQLPGMSYNQLLAELRAPRAGAAD